jgi:hypothetical protein
MLKNKIKKINLKKILLGQKNTIIKKKLDLTGKKKNNEIAKQKQLQKTSKK